MEPLDICLVRTCTLIVFAFTVAMSTGQSFTVAKEMRPFLLYRCLIGFVGFTSLTYATPMIPLLVQNTLFNTAPIWASLIGYFALRESLTQFEIFAMIVCFSGVLIIASQGLVDKRNQVDDDEHTFGESVMGSYALGCCLVLVTSLAYASVSVLTRIMQKTHWSVVLFYYGCLATPGTLILILI